jgi:hypothetical protein
MVSLSKGEIPEGLINKDVLERPGFKNKLGKFK